MPSRREIPNLDDLVQRYRSGTSFNKLANESGYSRCHLFRCFTERGEPMRGRSDAERLKWQEIKRDPERVRRQVASAQKARRGMRDTIAVRLKRAVTCYERLAHIGPWEAPIIDAICAKDRRFIPQFPIGPYNVDVAIGELGVAVEVQATYHPTGSTRPERIEYLLDAGWAVLIVYAIAVRTTGFNGPAIAEQCAAFAECVSRDPSIRCQYGMIGSKGQRVTPRGFQFPKRPRVDGF